MRGLVVPGVRAALRQVLGKLLGRRDAVPAAVHRVRAVEDLEKHRERVSKTLCDIIQWGGLREQPTVA